MLPKKMTEASCAKCHKQQVYVPKAEKLNLAYATYERAGCYACHKTKGFDTERQEAGADPDEDRLEADAPTGSRRGFAIRRPSSRRPGCRASGTTRTPARRRTRSATRSRSTRRSRICSPTPRSTSSPSRTRRAATRQPASRSSRGIGDRPRIGCLGCHVVGEGTREEAGPRRTFGQPLENIGNKTTYEWVFNWVRDPKHYNPGTYMPNLRLTDAQAADVATYLMTLKQGGAATPPRPPTPTRTSATCCSTTSRRRCRSRTPRRRSPSWIAQAKQIALGQRVIGRYGCFSCHDIKGFEKAQPIGTDLSEEGSKLVTRLDFAFITDIPHTSKLAWFRTKLHDPRDLRQGARAAAARQAADAELRVHRRRESSGC